MAHTRLSTPCLALILAAALAPAACEDIEDPRADAAAPAGDGGADTADHTVPEARAVVAAAAEIPALAAYLDLAGRRLYVAKPAAVAAAIQAGQWKLEWAPGAPMAVAFDEAGGQIPVCVVPADDTGPDAGAVLDAPAPADDGGGGAGGGTDGGESSSDGGGSEGGLGAGATCTVTVRFTPEGVGQMQPTVGSTRLLTTLRRKVDVPMFADPCMDGNLPTIAQSRSSKMVGRKHTVFDGDGSESGPEVFWNRWRRYAFGVKACAAQLLTPFEEFAPRWVVTADAWPNP